MTLAPGTTVGRYQILEPLGQGGMATVYKAFQPSLQREVALKVLRPGYAQDQEFRERFEREAIAIARLRHPHIVQVHDFEVAQSGEYVLAMEFLEGGTLKDRLSSLAAQGRGLDPAQSVRILGEVAQALAYAHEKGVIHRDVKPSNVMLTQKDWAVVTDFGIARILGATSHTQTGVGIGTPEYMAPEQGQGTAIDHRADIYSLGAMAYELLTGRVPYSADTPLAVVLAHIKDPLPLPSKINPSIGKGTEKALLKALAKDPAARFESATAFAEALSAGLAEDTKGGTMPTVVVRGATASAAPSVARPAPAAPRHVTLAIPPVLSQRPIVTGAAAAAVLVLVVSGVVAGNAFRAAPQASITPAVAAATVAPSAPAIATVAPATAAASANPPKFAIPPKGALIWEAKLDGSAVDINVDRRQQIGDADTTVIRQVPGAIELAVTKPAIGWVSSQSKFMSKLSGTFPMPRKSAYVGELELSYAAGSAVDLTWTLKQSRGPGQYWVFFDAINETLGIGCNAAGCPPDAALIDGLSIPGLQQGRTFTVAAVVDEKRITLYLDQKQIAQVDAGAVADPTASNVSIAGPHDVPGKGTVKIIGARFYELPATSASAPAPSAAVAPTPAGVTSSPVAASTVAPTVAPATAAVPATPTPPPTPAPPPKFAIPPKGALLYEAALDGTGGDLPPPHYVTGPSGGAVIRHVPGAIELAVTKPDSVAATRVRVSSRLTYVLEYEASVAPGAEVSFNWGLRRSGSAAYFLDLLTFEQAVQLAYYDGAKSEILVGPIPIPGLQAGRTIMIAAVVEDTRFSLYVDQKLVGQASDTRIKTPGIPDFGIGARPRTGTVRITGLRLYDLP